MKRSDVRIENMEAVVSERVGFIEALTVAIEKLAVVGHVEHEAIRSLAAQARMHVQLLVEDVNLYAESAAIECTPAGVTLQ